SNGQITIQFSAIANSPIINAIEIMAVGVGEVVPTTVNLWSSQKQQFLGRAGDPYNAELLWTLTPASAGSITAAGLYTAPAMITTLQTVTVTATDAAVPAWFTTATVVLHPPVSLSLAPVSVNLTSAQTRQFTATLTNDAGTGVTWSLSPVGKGSISATGLYTAPADIYTPGQTVILTATAVDGHIATATIALVPAAMVSVTPTTATLGPSEMQQFTARVTGAWNTGVTWSINPAGMGTITSAGVYTAPSSITANTNVTITATSVANPDATASAALTLSPASPSVSVAVTPSTAALTNGQTQQFAATVAGAGNTAVTWSVIPTVGSISASGLYTAPASIAAPQTITVQAASAASPANFATGAIMLSPAVKNNYSYRRAIVIDHTKVPNTDQASFPVLISGTYSYLATVVNDGKVQDANGYDIVFSSDCAGLQKLDHEIESYNPATGAMAMWIRLPNVSHTADTTFYLSYGNGAITTSQENRPPVDDARNPGVTHSADWVATQLNNQSSPATFYAIYPENANSIAPLTALLGSLQTQQFAAILPVTAAASRTAPLVLLGSVQTPSPAESLAVNGNLAYVCDDNEVSIIDVTDAANPRFITAALADSIKNSGDIHCSIQRNTLAVFADGVSSGVNGARQPAFVTFDLSDPLQPQLLHNAPVSARYFTEPAYAGNTAFMGTDLVDNSFGQIWGAWGQVFSIDITDLANPRIMSALLPDPSKPNSPPDPTNAIGPQTGLVLGATLVSPQVLYAVGSNDPQGWGTWNRGQGKLLVADISNPAAMALVKQVNVPGTIDLHSVAIQGNVAVAVGDNGGLGSGFQGNVVITTFDITDPRNPVLLATKVTPYTPGKIGAKARIGDNLFLFGAARDSSGQPVMLLVDIGNPSNPTVTPYSTATLVTRMVAIGNVLHTTNGAGGYAAYRIPGVEQQQYQLTGSCNVPVNWMLSPPGLGAITPAGLYTAPANITAEQTVTVVATSQNDPAQWASATLTLSPVLQTSLAGTTPGPYVAGSAANFQATVTSLSGTPMSGIAVTLNVTGVNTKSLTATTDSDGHATFSYTSTVRGSDTLRAGTTGNSSTSSALPVFWVSPVANISTTTVTGRFFHAAACTPGCEAFTTLSSEQPVFTQNFPNLMFDPFAGMLAANPTGVGSGTRPFTDIVLDAGGAVVGTIVAQGNGSQAGTGSLAGFSAVLRGSFVVAQPGAYTFNVASADGFLFGVGAGAGHLSGIAVNPPASGLTPFAQQPLRPLHTLVLTSNGNATRLTGQQVAKQIICALLRTADRPVADEHDPAVSEALLFTDLRVFPAGAVELGNHICPASVRFVDGHGCVDASPLQSNGLHQTRVRLSFALRSMIVARLQMPAG
ncbi:MAG: Ig-like domain-containing protein, partial [Acidobacteriia bacterium]|nr:Ig-like domain-containing protein [Terriglobia bacterium]